MKPVSVRMRNYRTFADETFSFADGCTALVGPNGAGKSAVIEAVEVALFGRCRTGGLAAQLSRGEDVLELTLVFEHGGELFRVRRGYSAAGRGKATLDFEKAVA